MRVANKIRVGGVDYVRLERSGVLIQMYTGEILRFAPAPVPNVETRGAGNNFNFKEETNAGPDDKMPEM